MQASCTYLLPMRKLHLAPLFLSQLLFSTVGRAQASGTTTDVTIQVDAEVVLPAPPTESTAPVVVVALPPPAIPSQSPTTFTQSAQPYSLAAPQMRVEHQMNRGLAIGGGVLFAVSWAVNILGSGLGTLFIFAGPARPRGITADETFGASFIPVIGPLIFAGVALDRSGGYEPFAAVGIIDAVAQAAGLTMLIIGIVGEDVEVNVNAQTALIVLPYATGEGTGISVSGTF